MLIDSMLHILSSPIDLETWTPGLELCRVFSLSRLPKRFQQYKSTEIHKKNGAFRFAARRLIVR